MVEVQDLKRAVLLKRSVQIPELPVHSRNHCGVSQALAENNESITARLKKKKLFCLYFMYIYIRVNT